MESNFDPVLFKNKFAYLIAKLHEIGFTNDYISYKIATNDFFSLFENNNNELFLTKSNDEIIEKVFGKDRYSFDYGLPPVSEYLWAGLMYFTLLQEYHIPLERQLLLWPLSTMIDKYNPYHEMPSNALYEDYIKDEKAISILKRLKQMRNMSSRELSVLTGISKKTIDSYTDNEKLFAASYTNISLLSKALNVKMATFKKTSDFVLFSKYSFNNEEFVKSIKKKLIEYFDVDDSVHFVDTYKTHDELLKIGKEHHQFIYLPDFALVKYRNKLEYYFIEDYELNLLFKV